MNYLIKYVYTNCAVSKIKQFAILKIWIFTRTPMPRPRQNDRIFSPERRCHGPVKMTVSERWVWFWLEWFTRPLQTTLMSRITISMQMIFLRQTGRSNDRSSNCRPCVTSQRQDRHLRLIHLQSFDFYLVKIIPED
jgi:hypothetical protein